MVIGTILITALNFLKEHDLLNATSPIPNIGLVAAIYRRMGLATSQRHRPIREERLLGPCVVPMVEEAGITITGPDDFKKTP